jgi:transcriptional regulator GlxA family with amidase domain
MCNLSTSYFTHLFTKNTGYSPLEYKTRQRINIAKNLLATTNLSVKEISTIIGFKDPLYFGRCFKRNTGQSPSEYREKK